MIKFSVAVLIVCTVRVSVASAETAEAPLDWLNTNAAQCSSACEDGRSSVGLPAYVTLLETQEDRERHESEARDQIEHAKNERVLVIATVILAFVTMALALFTAMLWNATHALATGADKTAKLQLRAYLTQSADYEPMELNANSYQAIILINNGGSTPGFEVSVWGQMAALTEQEAAQFAFPPRNPSLAYVAFPHGKHSLTVTCEQLNAIALAQIAGDQRRFYIWGEIGYRDIFDDEHVTRFRMVWRTNNNMGVWSYCEDGNSAT